MKHLLQMPGVSAATILVPKPFGFESGDKQRGAAVVSLDGVEVWDGSQLVGKGQEGVLSARDEPTAVAFETTNGAFAFACWSKASNSAGGATGVMYE
jgi:hypothetical protein